MVAPQKIFSQLMERSGCSHTTEDFFHRETVEGEKWMWSHQGNPNKQKVKNKIALFNWTTQNL